MEKSYTTGSTARLRKESRGYSISLTCVAVICCTWLFAHQLVRFDVYKARDSSTSLKPFSWNDIEPSTRLDFRPCFDIYECARLDVPLDWTANSTEQKKRRAAIAITRLPGKVLVTDKRYGGAILINPGGPGGSGVGLVSRDGKYIQTVAGSGNHERTENEEVGFQYDVIGFDPRGVNNTTPGISCFPDDGARQFWAVQSQAQGLLSDNRTFPYVFGRTQALSESCSALVGNEEKHDIGKFVSTPSVVQDMVAIIEALGEWRERKAKSLLKKYRVKDSAEIIARAKWNEGKEKLLYWGFSYGTLLGATFASMYPERVGRVVLDGVCDANDYYAGTWLRNLDDTDSIIESFFRQCYAAGPNICPLFSSEGPDGSRKIFNKVLDQLYLIPLSIPATAKNGPDLITWSDVIHYVVVQTLYTPEKLFPRMARIMDDLSRGNGSELAIMKQSDHAPFCRTPLCEENPYSEACHNPQEAVFRSELSASILCTDGPASLQKWTAVEHYHKWQYLRNQSSLFAPYWAEITMYCSGWNIRPAWNFTTLEISSNKTANPLLFVSNTRDPVTPLRNARTMMGRFAGSGLLVQDADGHCSASAPGVCAAERIRRYFQKGELPEEGLLCRPDKTPFQTGVVVQDFAGEDIELFEAVHRLAASPKLAGQFPLHI